jgi:HAD superfamily hydrolase (TIGR01490 family)
MKNNYTIAVFDFDGTITRKDTLNHFIISNFGFLRFLVIMTLLSPLIFLYKMGILSNHVPKEKLFRVFFKNMEEGTFNLLCKNYSINKIDKVIRRSAMNRIKWHKEQGHELVIVTASIRTWIQPWAEKNGFSHIISTGAEIHDGLLTGKFKPKNCYGKEKVRRFLEKYPNRAGYLLYVYGDGRGDREIIGIADKPFFRSYYE